MGRKKRSAEDAALDAQIGLRLARFRQDLGWSQAKLGAQVDLSAAQISDLEAGNHGFTAVLLAHVAQVLGRPIELFFGAENTNAEKMKPWHQIYESLQERDRMVVMDLARKLAYWPKTSFRRTPRQDTAPLLVALEGIDGVLLDTVGHALETRGIAGRRVKYCTSDYTSPLWSYMIPRLRALEYSEEPNDRRAMERTMIFAYERLLRQEYQIRPALEAGHIVVAPFFAMAAEVYQEVEGSPDRRIIDAVVETSLRKADLIILIHSDPADAVRRATREVPGPEQFFSQYAHEADFATAMRRYSLACEEFKSRQFDVFKVDLHSTATGEVEKSVTAIEQRCRMLLQK